MYTRNVFAAGALLSLAAAVPMANKRDLVWETQIEVVVETVQATTTVWVDGTAPTPVAAAASHYGHGHGGHKHTTTILSTSTVPYSPAESSPVAPASPESSYVAPTSVYVPPPAPTSEAPAPTSDAPAPTTEAPAPTTEAPAPTSYAAPATTSAAASSGGSSPSGEVYEGDITYYAPGLGSCGKDSSGQTNIVALSHLIMEPLNGANPNTNPLCGKTITISYDGGEHTAEVVDTCPGCDYGSIDLTNALFLDVAPNGDGRVSGVKWWFNN